MQVIPALMYSKVVKNHNHNRGHYTPAGKSGAQYPAWESLAQLRLKKPTPQSTRFRIHVHSDVSRPKTIRAHERLSDLIACSSSHAKPKDSAKEQERLTHLYNEKALRYGIVFDELIRQVAVHSIDLAALVEKVSVIPVKLGGNDIVVHCVLFCFIRKAYLLGGWIACYHSSCTHVTADDLLL